MRGRRSSPRRTSSSRPERDREPRALYQQVPLGRDADDRHGEVSVRHLRHPQLQGEPCERGPGTQRPVPCLAHLRLPAHRDALLPDVPYREVLSGQDQASRCRYLSRARLPDGRRLLDGADGGGEVVRGCGWNDERSVHPGADRHSRRGRKEGVGRHTAPPLGGQGRALRDEDAESLRI